MNKKRLTYFDVQDLPPDDPLSIEFMRQLEEEELAYARSEGRSSIYDDEESSEYFERFIADER